MDKNRKRFNTMSTFSIEISQPFHLESVVKTHGWFQLIPFYWDNITKTLNWAVILDGVKPRLVSLRSGDLKNKVLQVILEIQGPLSAKQKERLVGKVQTIFNLRQDLGEFYKICEQDPLLKEIPKRGMGRLMRCESVFEDVFKSICGTNVQWKQAVKMINTIGQIGSPVPGSDFRTFPAPEVILQHGEKFLRDTGRVGYRSSYLMALCERIVHGDPLVEQVENGEIAGKELLQFFLSFKGIGKITARYLAALYGYYEEMAVDSLVVAYMKKTHFDGVQPTIKQIEAFYSQYGQWRYLVYWMEFIVAGGWKPDADSL
jgi:3-methyladenine DNA glycosylase/8-oxoguanine DNA glycosylase